MGSSPDGSSTLMRWSPHSTLRSGVAVARASSSLPANTSMRGGASSGPCLWTGGKRVKVNTRVLVEFEAGLKGFGLRQVGAMIDDDVYLSACHNIDGFQTLSLITEP